MADLVLLLAALAAHVLSAQGYCLPINLHNSWMTPVFTQYSVISSTSPSPPQYLHLTIFTSPSTAYSNLTDSPLTSLLHPISLALPSSLLHQSSLSLPPASSNLAAYHCSSVSATPFPPRHSHLAVSTLQSNLVIFTLFSTSQTSLTSKVPV